MALVLIVRRVEELFVLPREILNCERLRLELPGRSKVKLLLAKLCYSKEGDEVENKNCRKTMKR